MIHVNYELSTIGQRMIAVAGNFLGGALVLILGILGAFFEYENLAKNGFSVITIPCYAVVMFSAFLILARVKYAVLIAVGAELLELLSYITMQVTTPPNVSFLILIKVAVIVCSTQLMVKIVSFDDAPPEARPVRRGPQPPQGRVIRRNPPQARR